MNEFESFKTMVGGKPATDLKIITSDSFTTGNWIAIMSVDGKGTTFNFDDNGQFIGI